MSISALQSKIGTECEWYQAHSCLQAQYSYNSVVAALHATAL